MHEPLAVYVHIPFCPTKCGYCDFNSYAMSGDIVQRTVDAIEKDIRQSPDKGRPAKTIFFGGGTPTFLSGKQLARLLDAVTNTHPPIDGCEITSEANPGTVDASKFQEMRSAGFNRLSIGAQSFQSGDLMRLGRIHDPSEIIRAISKARKAGFENINIDLMFALPGQSLFAWKKNLQTALQLETQHLSLYCLTIEPNTKFYRHHLKGMLHLPDEECQIEMYNLAVDLCKQNGLEQYEISNFAKPGQECLHNICYWMAEEYAGYGPGAVGATADSGVRTRRTKIKHPERYCLALEQNEIATCESEILTDEILNFERIMLGIRLNRGLQLANIIYDQEGCNKLVHNDWAIVDGEHLHLTPAGRHFCSEAALMLIPDQKK